MFSNITKVHALTLAVVLAALASLGWFVVVGVNAQSASVDTQNVTLDAGEKIVVDVNYTASADVANSSVELLDADDNNTLVEEATFGNTSAGEWATAEFNVTAGNYTVDTHAVNATHIETVNVEAESTTDNTTAAGQSAVDDFDSGLPVSLPHVLFGIVLAFAGFLVVDELDLLP